MLRTSESVSDENSRGGTMALIDSSSIVGVLNRMLSYVDPRLVKHGMEVAFVAEEILPYCQDKSIDKNTLLFLSLLHDIGAYKTAEVDEMVSFDGKKVWRHSVYGYLFLKYLSPLRTSASAILYHHLDYQRFNLVQDPNLSYAALIHLADRVAVLSKSMGQGGDYSIIQNNAGTRFKPEFVKAFFKAGPDQICAALHSGEFENNVNKRIHESLLSDDDSLDYLRMMVFSLDIRSEYTISHTIMTREFAVELASRMGYSGVELQKIGLGGLLHDVGKIAIPPSILESQGKLNDDEMVIMRRHVLYTRKIIEGLIDDGIAKIAYRHHERLDGTGYPEGLSESQMSVPEQIMAVADIASALSGERSYKEAFPKEKVIAIMGKLDEENKINHQATRILIDNFDEIKRKADLNSGPFIKTYEKMLADYLDLSKSIQSLLVY